MTPANQISHPLSGSATADAPVAVAMPPEFVELTQLRAASLEHRLGYFGDRPLVIFGYCPGGGEVIWKDGLTSGFGAGGWKTFLQEIAPLAAQLGAFLGDLDSAGTHVLLMDRTRGALYAAPRDAAEAFLARAYNIPLPKRPCLCSLMSCAACPVKTCIRAGLNLRGPASRAHIPPAGRKGEP